MHAPFLKNSSTHVNGILDNNTVGFTCVFMIQYCRRVMMGQKEQQCRLSQRLYNCMRCDASELLLLLSGQHL
jgi:hypothetical protein